MKRLKELRWVSRSLEDLRGFPAEVRRNVGYVLHAFKKKSKSGVSTPRKEIDLIHRRLRLARDDYRELNVVEESRDEG